jgi:hypothetical protein
MGLDAMRRQSSISICIKDEAVHDGVSLLKNLVEALANFGGLSFQNVDQCPSTMSRRTNQKIQLQDFDPVYT